MEKLSHVDENNKPSMVDVSNKKDQLRKASASGFIELSENTVATINENKNKKGNVLITAELSGIMAGKKTHDLIPLCHPLNTTKIAVEAILKKDGVCVNATAICIGKTGVEMEALTAVSIALLTIYDMCKAIDKTMKISNIVLDSKTKEDAN